LAKSAQDKQVLSTDFAGVTHTPCVEAPIHQELAQINMKLPRVEQIESIRINAQFVGRRRRWVDPHHATQSIEDPMILAIPQHIDEGTARGCWGTATIDDLCLERVAERVRVVDRAQAPGL